MKRKSKMRRVSPLSAEEREALIKAAQFVLINYPKPDQRVLDSAMKKLIKRRERE